MITFSEICRLCINKTHSDFTVQFVDEDAVTLGDKMKTACDIQINAYDCLPTSICELCVDKLRQFYDFKLQCLESNRRLVKFKKQLINSTSKDEKSQNVPECSKKELTTKVVKKINAININSLINKLPNVRIKATNINSVKNNVVTVQQIKVLDVPPLVRISAKPTSNHLLTTKHNNSQLSKNISKNIDPLNESDVESINNDDNSMAYDDFDDTDIQASVTDNLMKQNISKDPLLDNDTQVNTGKDNMKTEEKVADISLEMLVEKGEDELMNQDCKKESKTVEPTKNQNSATFGENIKSAESIKNSTTCVEQAEDNNVNSNQANTEADIDDPEADDASVANDATIDHKYYESYFCQPCNKVFKHKGSYSNHQRYHAEHAKNYQCDRCGKKFKLKYSFEKHMLRYSGKRPYKCDKCDKTFTDKVYLYAHSKAHSDARPYQCEVCGKTFKFASCRRTHMSSHSTERPFECTTCGKAFAQKTALTAHMRTHSGERPFQCTICNKRFADSWALKKHGITHTTERKFQCDICKMFFKRAEILRGHRKIHFRDPNEVKECKFTCEICGKTVRTKDSLIKHAGVHSDGRPFKCELCNKSFKYESCRRSHVRIYHEGKKVKCEVCGKTLHTNNVLARHMLLHTGEKPHKCDLCGKCFADVSSLRDHKLSHSNIRPYKCEYCEKEFKKKYNRFLHMRKKHGDLVKETDTNLAVETDEQTTNDSTMPGIEEETTGIMMAENEEETRETMIPENEEEITETMVAENEEHPTETMMAENEDTTETKMAENEEVTSKILIVQDEEPEQEREKLILENVQCTIDVQTSQIPALHYYK